MKKLLSAALAGAMLLCPLASCGHTTKSGENVNDGKDYGDVSGDPQTNGTAEEALRDAYAAIYSKNNGDICYNYIYPKITIDILKKENQYDSSIENYNKGQAEYIDLIDCIPKIVSIDKVTPFNEEQLKASNELFASISSQAGIITYSDNFNCIEGYEFELTITNTQGQEDTDKESVIFIENDGWKVVPMGIDTITEKFADLIGKNAAINDDLDESATKVYNG